MSKRSRRAASISRKKEGASHHFSSPAKVSLLDIEGHTCRIWSLICKRKWHLLLVSLDICNFFNSSSFQIWRPPTRQNVETLPKGRLEFQKEGECFAPLFITCESQLGWHLSSYLQNLKPHMQKKDAISCLSHLTSAISSSLKLSHLQTINSSKCRNASEKPPWISWRREVTQRGSDKNLF